VLQLVRVSALARLNDDSSETRRNKETTLSTRTETLLFCPRCDSELVYPETASEAGAHQWYVLMRCPNCERAQLRLLGVATMNQLDRELDRGTAVLARDLRSMEEVNMADFVKRFVAALEAGAIEPMDF
jgi:uncharacterized C2H2 Zn-finger protein